MNRNTLLIVDDMEINRSILRALFEQTYNLLEAENGEQALLLLNQYQDTIAVMLLDIVMPVKDGYQVLTEMEQSGLLGRVPVIVITAEGTSESEVRAFDLGASDIIMKPFEPHVVRRRVQNVIELSRHKQYLEEMVEEQSVKLRESQGVLMDALSSVIEHRSVETGQHILRIRMFTKVLLEEVMRCYPEYELDERKIQIIASAAALHDIGKIAIPDAVLNKPGRLTPEEFAIMKTHSAKGCEILTGLERMHDKEYLQYAYYICRYHHERWDGHGYPDGLKGEAIPIYAQAVGIADAYDALTTDRVYKKAYLPDKAYNMILNGECGAFSPRLLECFKAVRPEFVALTHAYADGASPKADFAPVPQQPVYKPATVEHTLELGQMKYLALLRYLDATMLEVDYANGVYHLIYSPTNDFDQLRSGDLFGESYLAFIRQSVHPDDREELIQHPYISEFLASGSTMRIQKYRVFHHASGEYIWYEVTVLRVSPTMQRILLIWRRMDQAPASAVCGETPEAVVEASIIENSLVGVQQCVNDRWMTITYVSDGFLALLGFGREEIAARFQDHYVEMIHPDDREHALLQLREKSFAGRSFELEYRVQTQDGRILHVLDKCQLSTGTDGVEYLNCVLIDVTQQKQAQEDLRLTTERHQIIMDQTNDIIFEWDLQHDQVYYSTNWAKKYGYEPITKDFSTRISQASHIMPEDVPSATAMMASVISGAPYVEGELRIANADGQYRWCRMRATTQYDSAKKPVKAVGVILDIDEEKRRAQDLINQAERDNLTKLLNKNTGRRRIQHNLGQTSSPSAMLLIDLDNFKTINDTRGHMFGDAVLVEVAAQLQKLVRAEDVVSRVGGDEFLIYLCSVPNKDVVQRRAEQVLCAIRNVLAEDLRDCRLSCSIGISYCADETASYPELFQRCDQALYQAKAQGKDTYCFYDPETVIRALGQPRQRPMAANTRIESDEAYDQETNGLVHQVFHLLYQASDLEAAIQSILELLGKRFHVSRAYIFEDAEDGASCCNTFEWCNTGVPSEMWALQQVEYEQLGENYKEHFNEYGIFYCRDISAVPGCAKQSAKYRGIHSMLQCAILNNGKMAGFVGFDDCDERRMWTQEQISALSFVSELLSVFLLKKRAQDRALATAQDLQMLLDNQNSWIYVIDPETYELNYINEKAHMLAPTAQMGMRCYKAFFQRETPCEQCPAQGILDKHTQSMEIFNPVLKVWALADASYIHWGEHGACLLCCHDITPYMPGAEREEAPPPEGAGNG